MRSKIAKGLLIFLLVINCSKGFAQNSEGVEEVATALDSTANKKEISNDSLLKIAPIDTTIITEKSFTDNFAQKYSDEAFNYEQSGGGKSLLDKINEWINNLLRHLLGWDQLKDINNFSQIFLNILFAIIFLAVVYIIVRLIMNHKGRWFFEKQNQSVDVNLDNVEEHIHEADFESMINETEKSGNTRHSIRLYYLWLLKTFTDKRFIEWHPEKTNADYVRELKDEAKKNDFRYLSYLYNYIWYGEFSINDDEYRRAREAFLKQLKPNGK